MRKQAFVHGDVQAVGFRYYTQAEARRLGLVGFVRNLRDGSVEVEAEGDPEDVAAMLAWLDHGPPSAVVESVRVIDRTPLRDTDFRIDY